MTLWAYPVSLDSAGVYTVDDVDKCESLRKVRFYYVIHYGGFTDARAVNYNDSLLKYIKIWDVEKHINGLSQGVSFVLSLV